MAHLISVSWHMIPEARKPFAPPISEGISVSEAMIMWPSPSMDSMITAMPWLLPPTRDLLVFDDVLTDSHGWFMEGENQPHRQWMGGRDRYSMANTALSEIYRQPSTMGIQCDAQQKTDQRSFCFFPYPRSFTFTRMDYAGVLKNLQPPPPKTNIRIQPYVLGLDDRYKNFPAGTDPEQNSFRTGGESNGPSTPIIFLT